jgi:hypothetical protein
VYIPGDVRRRLPSVLAVFALTLGLSAWPAGAQTTREAEIEREQAEKAARLRPPQKSKAEKVTDVLGKYFALPTGPYPWFGSVYGGGGASVGAGYRRAIGDSGNYNVLAGYSIRNYKLLQGTVGLPDFAKGRVRVDFGARWIDAPRVSFYGLGNGSAKGEKASFDYQPLRIDGTVTLAPARWIQFGGGPFYEDVTTGPGARAPSIEDRFGNPDPGFEVPGLGQDVSFVGARAFAGIDWRTSPSYTRRGGWYFVEWSRYAARESRPYDFDRVDAEVLQFVPLLRENWVIALRGKTTLTTGRDGGDVPYFQMPFLGSGQTLRGFANHRFIDRNLLLLQAEYRWTPSPVLDMAIFYDAGKVAARRKDLDVDGLHTDWGVGVRFHGPAVTALRIDLAKSREGWGLIFGTSLF